MHQLVGAAPRVVFNITEEDGDDRDFPRVVAVEATGTFGHGRWPEGLPGSACATG